MGGGDINIVWGVGGCNCSIYDLQKVGVNQPFFLGDDTRKCGELKVYFFTPSAGR